VSHTVILPYVRGEQDKIIGFS